MIVVFETESGRLVTDEIYVRSGVAYEVRTEVVGEQGSAMIGLDQNLQVKTPDGRWGGRITPGFVERFGQAYDIELQRWVDAAGPARSTDPGRGTVTPPSPSVRPACRPYVRGEGRGRPAAEADREPTPGSRLRTWRPLAHDKYVAPSVPRRSPMKLALDPQMFYATSSVYELPDIVASLGYDWMELSPKADFIPFFRYPRVDDAGVRRLKKVARDAGVGIASMLPLQRWAGPDEDQRQAAVRSWKRIIQITVDLGVDIINSEFNGRPEAPETAEAQFLKSLDELLPIIEREGLQLILEPHPDDFIEDGLDAVNMIRGLNRDWIGFLYCTPHAFHQGHRPPRSSPRRGRRSATSTWPTPGTTRPRAGCGTSPTRQATPPGCTSTWRWAWARWISMPSSPRWPASGSTAWSPAACSAGRRSQGHQRTAARPGAGPDRQALRQ